MLHPAWRRNEGGPFTPRHCTCYTLRASAPRPPHAALTGPSFGLWLCPSVAVDGIPSRLEGPVLTCPKQVRDSARGGHVRAWNEKIETLIHQRASGLRPPWRIPRILHTAYGLKPKI